MTGRIAIVGGGFGGVITAIHLMRQSRVPLAIEIIEPRQHLGVGLAYSTVEPEHRLNVPAHRMVLFDEDPAHFRDWFVCLGLDREDPGCDGGDGNLYASRGTFGRYMAQLLDQTMKTAPQPCSVAHCRCAAVDVETDGTGGWRLLLADGLSTTADAVVVCIGHTTSSAPAPFDRPALAQSGRVRLDPWEASAIAAFGADARLLILGQGLTMGDVLASLEAQRHRGPVVALSRRGLLARPYADSTRTVVPFDSLPDDARGSSVIRLMREACVHAVNSGHSWNSVIEATREQGGRLWVRLSDSEKCRLIRYARVFWDAHRYRMAPQVAGAIERAQQQGRLQLLAGRVVTAERTPDGIAATIRLRPADGDARVCLKFDAVISCVGPSHDVTRIGNPFIQALLRRGLARPHPTRLGFEVGDGCVLTGNAADRAGPQPCSLHVVGPLTRGACGDIVGAPEISRQARSVAAGLVKACGEHSRFQVRGPGTDASDAA